MTAQCRLAGQCCACQAAVEDCQQHPSIIWHSPPADLYGLAEVLHGVGQHHRFVWIHSKQLKDRRPVLAACAPPLLRLRCSSTMHAGTACPSSSRPARRWRTGALRSASSSATSLASLQRPPQPQWHGSGPQHQRAGMLLCLLGSNAESAARRPLSHLFAKEAGQDQSASIAIVA